ncbi:phosphoglucosamine mutase [Shewanella sp. 202IG2-18]|uniref:phosphoglucosamine mutase n=1 Tax=Parashewanella hymeniacidonis TaxID=2807618 RepID=UPI001961E0BE|nr:phosphoglucosamine mutase [Parashewanella hymeniacidonis]MBM7073043.1 phosphoglucosamine mutase [Parashewanella hymeniacidonis]
MSRKYFGTDGVRGKVGTFPITPSFAMKLGWAAGTVLASTGTKEVLIGKDTRISGYMLESAMEAGFSAAGVNVALVGPMPTPAVAYLSSTFRADAGVVISASHNPFYDNGIKFFSNDGTKLTDAQELEIERLLDKALNENAMDCAESATLGKARRIDDAAGRYIEFCKGTFPKHLSLHDLKIVVDSANGAAYHIAPNVYSELGAQIISINDKPDGLNINENCGATQLDSLQAAVLEHKADLGIALDGDADRVMFVDGKGEVVDGDEILFILAQEAKATEELEGGVVGTLMSNLGLELALKELDIPFKRAKVGDRYVVEQLKATGWNLGGEGSGHILSLNHASTGDGIVASLQVLKALLESGVSLAELKSDMTKLPQLLINVKLRADNADEIIASEGVQAAVKDAEGVLAENGRVLLRKSGTEPLIRVMVESTDLDMTKAQAEYIAEAVRKAG